MVIGSQDWLPDKLASVSAASVSYLLCAVCTRALKLIEVLTASLN